jgi:glycosyltransferase involved in cell wall biosynthesis
MRSGGPRRRGVRIAIDARPAFAKTKGGIGYYTWHLIRLLPRVDPEATYLAWYLDARRAAPRRSNGSPFRPAPNLVEKATPFPSRWFEELSRRYDLPRLEWFVGFDVLFAPNFVPPPTRARRLVLTVHDLAFRLFPETAPVNTRRWLGRFERNVTRATEVIAVSDQTRQDLLESYPVRPEAVTVVPLGVDHEVFRPVPEEEIEAVRLRYGIQGPYLLSLGGIEPRKNLPGVIRAFSSLSPDIRPTLVLVGARDPRNPEGWELLRSALQSIPPEIRRSVVLTGYVSEGEKAALLGGAVALVFPSLYEGFGLPIIEAMACGTPVLTSDVSALPATAGDAAWLVDPHDVAAIADGMERLVSDTGLREELRARGLARAAMFSWEETANRTAQLLHRASGEASAGC